MAIGNFNPTIWHAALLAPYNKAHVFREMMNRDYEGDIRAHGDSVKISSGGPITAKTYARNAGMGGTGASPTIAEIDRPEIGQASSMYLTISQEKYVSFGVDNIDKRQSNVDFMADRMRESAWTLANQADLYCASVLQTGVAGTTDGTGNRLTARTVGLGAGDEDAYKVIVDIGTKLDEANAPQEGRYVVVPA